MLKPKGNVLFAAGYGKDNGAQVLELQVNPITRQEAGALFALRPGADRKTRERVVASCFRKRAGMKLLSFDDTVAGGYPAVVVNLERPDEKGPQPIFMRVQKQMVYADGKMVLLNYMVMARPEDREKVLRYQKEGEAGDVVMFFESLVFKESTPQKRQEGGRK